MLVLVDVMVVSRTALLSCIISFDFQVKVEGADLEQGSKAFSNFDWYISV